MREFLNYHKLLLLFKILFVIIKAAKKEIVMKGFERNEATDLAVAIAELLDSKKAENIALYDITKLSSVANYMILATVSSTTQGKALSDFVEENLNKVGVRVLRRDGAMEWIVLDYNEVIVHIFTPEVRDFYHLEKIWGESKNAFSLDEVRKFLEKEEQEKNKQPKQEKPKKEKKEEKKKVASKKPKEKETKKAKKESK